MTEVEILALDREAEDRIKAAISARSVEQAQAAGAWVGRLAGLTLANMPRETAEANHSDAVHALARIVVREGDAQGISRNDAEPYFRAAAAGLNTELQRIATAPEGKA